MTKRIICIGDVMLDSYIYGTVKRIAPEAPVPVLAMAREKDMPGGAANVARNIASLGVPVTLIGVVGEDAAAKRLTGLLNAPMIQAVLVRDAQRPTTAKTRYVAGSQHLLRVDSEENMPVSPATQTLLRQHLTATIKDAAAVVLSDYAKGVLSPTLCQDIIAAARKHEIPVFVGPKGRDYNMYRGATVVVPNESELAEAVGHKAKDADAIAQDARQLVERYNFSVVLVTRGAAGMTLVDDKGQVIHQPTVAREVFDVSGASDTVLASFAVATIHDERWGQAMRFANTAAGIVVGKVGTATVTATEVEAALKAQDFTEEAAKIIPLAAAQDLVKQWRQQGLRVGFTNGCFDLMHPGHIALLGKARRRCDKLIVGVNSDASVRRLKGSKRPIQPQAARATVLAALAAVDAVVIFDEDTPLNIITTLHPDLLVKGADYAISNVVGAQEVMAYGGKVELIPLEAGQSTTAIVQKLSSPIA